MLESELKLTWRLELRCIEFEEKKGKACKASLVATPVFVSLNNIITTFHSHFVSCTKFYTNGNFKQNLESFRAQNPYTFLELNQKLNSKPYYLTDRILPFWTNKKCFSIKQISHKNVNYSCKVSSSLEICVSQKSPISQK